MVQKRVYILYNYYYLFQYSLGKYFNETCLVEYNIIIIYINITNNYYVQLLILIIISIIIYSNEQYNNIITEVYSLHHHDITEYRIA